MLRMRRIPRRYFAAETSGSTAASPSPKKKWTTSMIQSPAEKLASNTKSLFSALASAPGASGRLAIRVATDPQGVRADARYAWDHSIDTHKQYWVGTKLLFQECKAALRLIRKVLSGSGLSRRERGQLLRTTTDIFRIIPVSVFLIVPMMELLLPAALWMFPNMLPSTFHPDHKREDDMKRELKLRLSMAGFLTEAVEGLARKMKKQHGSPDDPDCTTARDVSTFVDKARAGTVEAADITTGLTRTSWFIGTPLRRGR